MVITRRIPLDEALARSIRDLDLTRPAGHPTEQDLISQNIEFNAYKHQREAQILRERCRKLRCKGCATQ
jgi:hypothetical protein